MPEILDNESVDEELQAEQERRREELARQQRIAQQQKAKLQQGLRVLGKVARGAATGQLKKAAAGTALRAIGTGLASTIGSAVAATAPIWGTVLAVIGIIIVIIALIILILAGICNSSVGYAVDYVTTGYCSYFEGVSTVIENAVGAMCSTPQIIAQQHGTAYPYEQNSPALTALMTCIESHPAVRGKNVGSKFTWEQSRSFCNYTRGEPLLSCGVDRCAHKRNSCHYGGRTGSGGAEAVDYGNEAVAAELIQAAAACGAGFWLNEGDHVHISTAACGSDGGDN